MTAARHDHQVRRISDLKPDYANGNIQSHELLGRATGARIGAGVTFWKDCEYSYSVWYDEIITCFSVDGILEMEIDGGEAQRLEAGDMVWLAEGTPVTYRVKGEATVLYSVTPVDWADRSPSKSGNSDWFKYTAL